MIIVMKHFTYFGIRINLMLLDNVICFTSIISLLFYQVKIMSGRVKVYGRVCKLKGNEAHFTDGSVASGLDAVVFCTGYAPDLSFLETEIIARMYFKYESA